MGKKILLYKLASELVQQLEEDEEEYEQEYNDNYDFVTLDNDDEDDGSTFACAFFSVVCCLYVIFLLPLEGPLKSWPPACIHIVLEFFLQKEVNLKSVKSMMNLCPLVLG